MTADKWYSTPRATRRRRGAEIMLSAEARARLEELVAAHPDGTKAAVVEGLILGTLVPDHRRAE